MGQRVMGQRVMGHILGCGMCICSKTRAGVSSVVDRSCQTVLNLILSYVGHNREKGILLPAYMYIAILFLFVGEGGGVDKCVL
jgi:hypothetical protein